MEKEHVVIQLLIASLNQETGESENYAQYIEIPYCNSQTAVTIKQMRHILLEE